MWNEQYPSIHPYKVLGGIFSLNAITAPNGRYENPLMSKTELSCPGLNNSTHVNLPFSLNASSSVRTALS